MPMQTPSVKLSSRSGDYSRSGSGTGFVSVFYLDTQDQFASDTIFLFKFILDVCAITMRSTCRCICNFLDRFSFVKFDSVPCKTQACLDASGWDY